MQCITRLGPHYASSKSAVNSVSGTGDRQGYTSNVSVVQFLMNCVQKLPNE